MLGGPKPGMTTEVLLRQIDLHDAIESMDCPVLIVDLDRERVLDVNEQACGLYGISRPELVGSPLRDISSDFIHSAAVLRAKLRTSRFYSFATRRKRRDGRELHLKVHAGLLDTDDGAVVLCVNYDITDQVHLSQQLEAAATDWQMTLDAIDEGVVVVDEQLVIQRANRAAHGLATAAYLVGTRLDSLPPCEPWTHTTRLAAQVLDDRTPMSMQITDPATQKTWDLSATLVPGGMPHAVVAMKDISNIVTLEASVRRNERVAEMGHLVGAVAHEVRNPLFVISATSDALQARLGAGDSVVAAHLNNLREQVDRLSALMHDLLEYGKPPQLSISVSPLDTAIAEAVTNVAPLAAADAVRILNEFPAGLGSILMDRARLARAVQNLLENAIHHTPVGGVVGIRGGIVNHSMRCWIWCAVEDSGPGFGAVEPSRVFEPFFSKRPGGTGLGLSIVQRTIELHGGRIIAANGEAGGARMTIELPRVEQ